jgi:predicted component of type VI protein secretion system
MSETWLDRRGSARGTKDGAGAEVSVLDQILEDGRLGSDPHLRERGRHLVQEFILQVLEGSITIGRNSTSMISARIAQIDHLVSIQLNEGMTLPVRLDGIAAQVAEFRLSEARVGR